ncbi:MAG: Ppx/GppA family phosphatase [Pseudomonadota bacterium]|nr:Ppx/GppA family phosphatase [Pseudomonadota bacterium]
MQQQPVAVIDIGSNSVRLVVYRDMDRCLLPLVNEKVACGLGRDLDSTGELHPGGTRKALDSLERFALIARELGAGECHVLATAAVRDATDGTDFIGAADRRAGLQIRIISGEEEARLSALGVIAGHRNAAGVTGDLGGGSLELSPLADGKPAPGISLPLGVLRLRDRVAESLRDAAEYIDHHLDTWPDAGRAKGQTFFAVGGTWRALARLHMRTVDWPLPHVHGYALDRDEARDFAIRLVRWKAKILSTAGIRKDRVESLPAAALLLERICDRLKPDRIVFSTTGLREGWMYSRMSPDQQNQDPLIALCREMAGGQTDEARQLKDWSSAAFPDEAPDHRRLREAVCLLSVRDHMDDPDWRAQQAFLETLHIPALGISHHERIALALAVHARHGGPHLPEDGKRIWKILSPHERQQAVALGTLIHTVYSLTGGALPLLSCLNTGPGPGHPVIRVEGALKNLLPTDLPDAVRTFVRTGRKSET